jgi:hypothetical protein
MIREGHIRGNKSDSQDYFTGIVIFSLLQQEFKTKKIAQEPRKAA